MESVCKKVIKLGEIADAYRDKEERLNEGIQKDLDSNDNEQEEVEVVDEVKEKVQELSEDDIKDLAEQDYREDKGKMGIKSKSKLLDQLRKKKRHTLLLGGKSMLGKSIITQSIAKELGFRLIETEDKPFYFGGYKNQIHVETWDELKREVFSTREPMVIDSITKLYQDVMAVTPWQESRFIINDMMMMINHVRLFGGIIVAHGQTKTIRNDDIGSGSPEGTTPEIEFVVEGNQRWLYRKTGLVIIGKHVLSSKKRMLFEGNHIDRKVYEVEIKKGVKGEPIVTGKGYEYLKYLLNNSMEILIQKGSK